LKRVSQRKRRAGSSRFAIVASRYNARYVDAMVAGARLEFERAGAAAVEVVRVPGAFEIPVVAARLARRCQPRYDAIVCLGVIIRGETSHAEQIGAGVTQALMRLQVEQLMPMIHEVLLLENREQAQARCLDPEHNRGVEAAQTALAMAGVMRRLGPLEALRDEDVPF